MASLILVRNVVGKLRPKRTLAASRGFLARLSCLEIRRFFCKKDIFHIRAINIQVSPKLHELYAGRFAAIGH